MLLHPSWRTFFALEWNGVYFVFCTLLFGWKASAYIYHNLGLAVTSAARSFAFDPQVLRPWKAARRCSACLYPNDVDANFCQGCGSRTCHKRFVVPTKTVDHAEIAKRFQEFNDVFKAKPYQRRKSALERELLDFLASLSPPRDISSCTSEEIVKFLISRDKSGKTVLHSQSCSEVPCNCPTRLAAWSVDC